MTTVCGVVVLSIGVALVVVNQRGTREFRRPREELKDVRIRWVKVESFKKWREEGRCIPRFQDREENDYIEEDRARSFTMWLLRTTYVVSHAWLTAAHPDPQGVQLDSLVCELAKCNWWKFWKRIIGCHDVVFFDYASLPQNGPNGQKRNDEEKELFNMALKGMNILHSHSSFQVLVIPDVPEGRQYKDRGWCYTELAISTAHGRVINDFRRSEVRRLIMQEEMPVLPNTFYRNFEGKEFTNKGDRAITMKIYSDYFKHVQSQVTHPARLVYVAFVTLPVLLILGDH